MSDISVPKGRATGGNQYGVGVQTMMRLNRDSVLKADRHDAASEICPSICRKGQTVVDFATPQNSIGSLWNNLHQHARLLQSSYPAAGGGTEARDGRGIYENVGIHILIFLNNII